MVSKLCDSDIVMLTHLRVLKNNAEKINFKMKNNIHVILMDLCKESLYIHRCNYKNSMTELYIIIKMITFFL